MSINRAGLQHTRTILVDMPHPDQDPKDPIWICQPLLSIFNNFLFQLDLRSTLATTQNNSYSCNSSFNPNIKLESFFAHLQCTKRMRERRGRQQHGPSEREREGGGNSMDRANLDHTICPVFDRKLEVHGGKDDDREVHIQDLSAMVRLPSGRFKNPAGVSL
jgi:hypothetical protein